MDVPKVGGQSQNTESYTYVTTDLRHKAFDYAVSAQATAVPSLVAIMAAPIEKIIRGVGPKVDSRNARDIPEAKINFSSPLLPHNGAVLP